MIKKILLGCSLFFAASAGFAGKVVVFDHQQAILETSVAQKALSDLKESSEFQQLVQEGAAVRADLEALQKEFEAEGITWSEETKKAKSAEAEKAQKSLQLAAKKAQSMQAAAVGKIAEEMQGKLEKILSDLMIAEKIDIIAQKQVVYTAVPAADITKKVTEELNKLEGK